MFPQQQGLKRCLQATGERRECLFAAWEFGCYHRALPATNTLAGRSVASHGVSEHSRWFTRERERECGYRNDLPSTLTRSTRELARAVLLVFQVLFFFPATLTGSLYTTAKPTTKSPLTTRTDTRPLRILAFANSIDRQRYATPAAAISTAAHTLSLPSVPRKRPAAELQSRQLALDKSSQSLSPRSHTHIRGFRLRHLSRTNHPPTRTGRQCAASRCQPLSRLRGPA